jgi:hypothetical protein
MNREVHGRPDEEMRAEYDFSRGVRGKHYEAYRAGSNVVFLDPDVAKAFTDSASVNQVLRLLLHLAQRDVSSIIAPERAIRPTGRGQRRSKKPKAIGPARG